MTATEHNLREGIVRKPDQFCCDTDGVGFSKLTEREAVELIRWLGFKFPFNSRSGKTKRKGKNEGSI